MSTFVGAVEAGKKNCFTPNPATRATAIAMIWWCASWNLPANEAVDDIIGAARKAAGGPYRKLLGHMTKVPYNPSDIGMNLISDRRSVLVHWSSGR